MAYIGKGPPTAPVDAYSDFFDRYGRSSVVLQEQPGYESISDEELGTALMHLEYDDGFIVDRATFQGLFNEVRRLWSAKIILRELSRSRARTWFPGGTKHDTQLRRVIRSQIMTIFSTRGRKRKKTLEKLRARGVDIPVTKASEHVADDRGQYDLGFA